MVNIPQPPKVLTTESFLKYLQLIIALLQKLQNTNKEDLSGLNVKIEDTKTELLDVIKTIELTPGEKGDTGATGERGADGVDGRDGKDGVSIKGEKGDRGADGKDADEATIISLASNRALEALKPLIPTIEAIEEDLPKLGASVRDSLELLKGDDRLKIEAIKDLKEELEKIRNAKISVTGGIGGGRYAYQIYNTPAGNISSTTVQDAINELDTEKEPNLPATPTNPDTQFLNGNREWATISIGAGGYAAPLYFTTTASDIAGYYLISYINQVAEIVLTRTISNTETLLRTYLFDLPIGVTTIDAGPWVANYRAKVNKTTGVSQLKFEIFLYHADTTETTLFSSYSGELDNLDFSTIREETNQPAFTVVATDRLGARIYAKTTSMAAVTFTTIVGDGNASYFTTPLAFRHDQLRARDKANSHPASAIQMDTLIGTPTYTSQNDYNNSFGSAGRKTGGYITKGTGSTVNVEAGTGFIKATDDDNAQLAPFNWAAKTGIAIPSDSTRYIGVDYSGGTPEIVSHTSYDWDFDTNWPLGRVTNDTINSAEELYIANAPWWVTDGTTNIFQAIRSFGLVHRDENVGGFILSQTGTRNIAVSGGTLWIGVNDLPFAGLDTAVTGTFEYYWYSSTGGWQGSDATQYSVTQYNDITKATLQNIPVGKYANIWVYGELTDSTVSIAIVYPQAYYNTPVQAEAKSAPDNLPSHISEFGTLLGRIIIKQGTNAPEAVETVFTTTFATSVASNHASLTNLAWTSSNHTGTASKLAGFDASGVASEYTEADYIKADGTRPFTGNVDIGANDLKVDTNTLFVDASENAVGFGTATPAQPIHIYKDDNSDALIRIDNPNSGTSARAGVLFRNGTLSSSEQFALMIAGVGYTSVATWQDAGVMFSSSGLSGGFHYAAYTGGIHFQTGGYGTSYDRLLVEDALTTVKNQFKTTSGVFKRMTTISTSTYTLTSFNDIFHVTYTTTGACAITLATAETAIGRTLIFKDAGGNAGTNNITISTEGTQKIDGADTCVIAVNYGYVQLYSNGTNWYIISSKLT